MTKNDVTIICLEKTYEKIMEAWNKCERHPFSLDVKKGTMGNEAYYMLTCELVVWCGFVDGASAIINALKEAEDLAKTESGYNYRLVEITEENNIIWDICDDEYIFADFTVEIKPYWNDTVVPIEHEKQATGMKVACANCGIEFDLWRLQHDENNLKGFYTSCNECGASFDIDFNLAITFITDIAKMADFKVLTKEAFLSTYNYVSEDEYEATRLYLNWLNADDNEP